MGRPLWVLLRYSKPQKRFAHDDFIAVFQRASITRRQAPSAVDKSSVGRPQIFDQIISLSQRNPRMTARNLSFGIVGIQIDIREHSGVRIPTADVCD